MRQISLSDIQEGIRPCRHHIQKFILAIMLVKMLPMLTAHMQRCISSMPRPINNKRNTINIRHIFIQSGQASSAADCPMMNGIPLMLTSFHLPPLSSIVKYLHKRCNPCNNFIIHIPHSKRGKFQLFRFRGTLRMRRRTKWLCNAAIVSSEPRD